MNPKYSRSRDLGPNAANCARTWDRTSSSKQFCENGASAACVASPETIITIVHPNTRRQAVPVMIRSPVIG
jgi:hypothetical protein